MSISFKTQAAIILAGLVLLLAALVTANCANSQGSRPVAGDTYVEAMVGAPRLVNPLLAVSDTDTDLSHLVYSGLVKLDTGGNLAPDLAAAWASSLDARVYTYTLKPGLHWQDGEPLGADDVAFTVSLLQASDFPGDPTLALPWRGVKVTTSGAREVSFTLPASDASFPQFTTLGILPRHLWAGLKASELASSPLNLAPVGSGPWRFVSAGSTSGSDTASESGSAATPAAAPSQDGVLLEPNPYMPPEGTKVSHIWFRLYPGFGAALTAFQLGEVHGLGHIPADRLGEVSVLPGVTLQKQPLARYAMLLANVQSPLLDKPETRQALEYAIDRQALVAQSLGGQAVPAYSPILPGSWAFDATVPRRGYDPAQARRLLDSAGWVVGQGGVRTRNGVTLTLVLAANSDNPENAAVSKQIQGYLQAVGVDVKLALVSRDSLLRDYLGPRAFQLALASWSAQGADPDLFAYWHSSQANVSGGLNFSGWSNPAADAALSAAMQTPDRAARTARYSDFQKAFAQDVPAVVLYSPLYDYATHPPATGVTLPHYDLLNPSYRFDTLKDWSLRP